MYAKDRQTVIDRREMLRVKLKSLAEEARIIRREESRTRGQLREELRDHRIKVVRYEARATHLAYGFIRGLTIEQMEPKSTMPWHKYEPLRSKVEAMIKKYGPPHGLTLAKAA